VEERGGSYRLHGARLPAVISWASRGKGALSLRGVSGLDGILGGDSLVDLADLEADQRLEEAGAIVRAGGVSTVEQELAASLESGSRS
jgi:hypothetical protein